MENRIRFIINADGSHLVSPRGILRALSEYDTKLFVIAPITIDTSVMVSYLIHENRNVNYSQYLTPVIGMKGKDLVDEQESIYQEVADWNVFGVTINPKAYAKISKYRAGRIGISFTLRDRITDDFDSLLINYKGLIGSKGDINNGSYDSGDYFECDKYNFYSAKVGKRLTKGSIVYFNGNNWLELDNFVATKTTTTEIIQVDPAVLAETPEASEETINEIIANYTGAVAETVDKVNYLEQKVEEIRYRSYYEFDNINDFPATGSDKALYLAKRTNTALEGDEDNWEDYNMLFRFDVETKAYIPVAGQGSGGGVGGAGITRVIPFPLGRPLNFTHAIGNELLLGFTYQNSIYQEATMVIFLNDLPRITKTISTGDNEIDVTSLISQGLNTIKIHVTDAEGTASQLIYRITGDNISLTTSFNDAVAIKNEDVFVPYQINGSPSIRIMHFTLNGVESEEEAFSNNEIKVLSGLQHGVNVLEMYVEGIYLDSDDNELYRINSNKITLNIIYDDGVSQATIISSKFATTSQKQGTLITVDYVVYSPITEIKPVKLFINNELVNELLVDDTRHYWNIKTLSVGTHTLRIESGGVYVEKIIEITQSDLSLEVIKDSFLRLYLTAFGKTNNDTNRDEWTNSYGASIPVELSGFNYTNNGWINDSLRLVGQTKAEIGYKPFATEIPSSGRTIEFDFKTRFTIDEDTVLMSCVDNNIGFQIKTQSAELKGSNSTVITRFKDDEHMKIAFTINPFDKSIITYINGVISGVDFYSNETSFRQFNPKNISINPNGGALDVLSIRVYERALTAKEILNNFIAEINDPVERLEKHLFNDIYDNYGNASIEKMKELIPIMIIEGSPLPQAKLRPRPFVNVYFNHPFDPSKNFERTGMVTDIDAQGTSSLQYPVKNFKIRLDRGLSKSLRKPYQMEPDMIPELIFTLKADYMDSSHANNTGLAKLFDSMYNDKIPPQNYDSRVRTTVYGYPIALFHRLRPNDKLVYQGIYNFNLDKDAEDSVGLNNSREWQEGNPDSVFPLTQSFEVTFNQDSGAGAFQDNDLANVVASFEARYPELDEDPEYTATGDLIVRDDIIEHYTKLRELIQWVIDNNDQESFKTEFALRFGVEHTLKYLIATEIFGLVDNLGKNMMLNTWDGFKWYPNFYDIDTAFGLENQGRNIHDYDAEIGDIGVYATTDSWLWTNVMKYFRNEIKTYYSELRQGVFDYNNILKFIYEEQISKISESQYNLDTYAKYIGVTTAWLWMAQGNRIEHIKRWLTNRLAMYDSKYQFGDYMDKSIAIRMNVMGSENAHLTLTPVLTQYVGVRFGNTIPIQAKTKGNNPMLIKAPDILGDGLLTNMEVWVYGAEYLEDIGDISHLNASSVSTDNAKRLVRLIIGRDEEGYVNDKLTQVSVGRNTYLEEIDLTNCTILGTNTGTGATEVLDLSEAENIKKVYALGTKLKGVSFAIGSNLEEAKLPNTITQLVLRNAPSISDDKLYLEGLNNVELLWLENVPKVDVISIFNLASSVQRLRLMGIAYSMFNIGKLEDLIEKVWDKTNNSYRLLGINSSGVTVDNPVIGGKVKVLTYEQIPQATLNLINSVLPNLDVEINQVASGLTFNEVDGGLEVSNYTGSRDILDIPAETNADLSAENDIIFSLDGWKKVVSIGGFALSGKSFKQVIIPEYVKEIKQGAFSANPRLEVVTIPKTVEKVDHIAFNNNGNAIILVAHESKPALWHENWNGNVTNVLWGVPEETRAFEFNTNGGSDVATVYSNVLLNLPEAPIKYGYDFDGWLVNGEPLTLPYVPNQDEPETIIIEASWKLWTYTVKYMKPISSDNMNWTLHAEQQVEFGQMLGEFYTDVTTGSNKAEVDGLTFMGLWKINDTDDLASISYQPNQDANTHANGKTIYLYGQYINSNGIEFTYMSETDAYDVTGYNYSAPAGSVNLFIPAHWDDGINGYKPVKKVGGFSSKRQLKTVIIEEGIEELGDSAFSSCSSLNSITIPESVTSIGNNAFNGCSSLNSITIPESVTSIGNNAFNGCSSLNSITIPESVTSIGNNAFNGCSSLNSITIPESVTSIGSSAFRNCSSLTSIAIPENVTSIGNNAFQYCSSLTSITIPESVTSIGNNAFNGCSSLNSITIPESVTSIGYSAFRNCSSLTSIAIPENVTSIGNNAFDGCSLLEEVFAMREIPPTLSTNVFNNTHENLLIKVLPNSVDAYKTATNWKTYADKIVSQ